MCGEAFRRRYIEGDKGPGSVATVIGSATHKSAEIDLTEKKESSELLPDEAIPDLAADAFTLLWDTEDIELTKEEKHDKFGVRDRSKDMTIKLAQLHHADLAPEIQPEIIEERLEVKLPGFPLDLVGYPDVVEIDGTIRDLKTRARKPAQGDAAIDLGLSFYNLAIEIQDGRTAPELKLDVLTKTKTPKRFTDTVAPQANSSALIQRIERAALTIESGAFMPADPGHWKCSEKFCDYYSDCPWGKASRKSFTQ